MPQGRSLEFDKHILGVIWTSDEAYTTLEYLCDSIGHRFAGSDQEHRAAEFLAQKMREYGLENVELEEFEMATWDRGPCSVSVTQPDTRDLPSIALPFCPSAEIEAELIDVGDGEHEDFQRHIEHIPGRIVLTNAESDKPGERKSHRRDKFNWAIEYGAIACVFMNQNPGMLRITGSIPGSNMISASAKDREAAIPGVGISYEAGKMIRRIAKQGQVHVRIATENATRDSKSYNVVGEILGSSIPEEIVLLGGHYDGHDIAQGAGDDGAGTITGLEAGRALAGLKGKLKRTTRVICFGSEEVGLIGALQHAYRHKDEKFRFVLNLDGAGRGSGGEEQLTTMARPEIATYFESLKDDLVYDFDVVDEFDSHSDHLPFAVRGIPNGTLKSKDATAGMIGRGYGHTEADTFDKINPRGLQMSAILAARLAVRLSEDEDFPGRIYSQDEVRQQLSDAGVLQRQEQQGRFPPMT